MTINLDNLSVRYQGFALSEVTFDVRPGEIVGFLGPNGAGKSTTLRTLLGLERPTSGSATFDGTPYARLARPMSTVGSLLDTQWMNGRQRAQDYLRWLAVAGGLDRSRIPELLDLVKLTAARRKKVSALSMGMRQRLGIAGALLGDPRYLIFDEPLNGLDPEGIRWVRALLMEFRDQGKGILLSSHILNEVAACADRVVMISDGKVVGSGSVSDFSDAAGLRIGVSDPQRAAEALACAGYTPIVDGADGVVVQGGDAATLTQTLSAAGIDFTSVVELRASLEDAFFERLGSSSVVERNLR